MTITTLIELAVVALSLAACVDPDHEPVVDEGLPPVVLVETVDPSFGTKTRVLDAEQAPVDLPGSACTCETNDCVADWIESTVGCGVCIDLRCADGRTAGGCVACDEPNDRGVIAASY
jgi:hypothetical protein